MHAFMHKDIHAYNIYVFVKDHFEILSKYLNKRFRVVLASLFPLCFPIKCDRIEEKKLVLSKISIIFGIQADF